MAFLWFIPATRQGAAREAMNGRDAAPAICGTGTVPSPGPGLGARSARSGMGTFHALSSGRGLRRIPTPDFLGYPDARRVRAQAVAASRESGSGAVGVVIWVFPESRSPRSAPGGAVIREDRGSDAGSRGRCIWRRGLHVADARCADPGPLLLFAPTKIGLAV